MGSQNPASHKTLTAIFSKVNMSDLPAMSNHVQELLSILDNKQTTAQDLADVILKDASLTTKLLQIVNSAYYSRGVPVTCVSRAITAVGFETLKELALTLALFEDFIKAGIEKEEISKLLTKCFLSASQAKILCKAKHLQVVEEEVFICTLLHELGKIIILVYMPEFYRKSQELIDRGYSDEFAAKTILNDLTFTQIGMEIARFWNFSEKIVLSMTDSPPAPTSRLDSQLYLLNVASFCNRLTWIICYGTQLELAELIMHYGPIFPITEKEALTLMKKGIEAAENISDKVILFGLSKLGIHSKLKEKAQQLSS